jgi:hypothetical protein
MVSRKIAVLKSPKQHFLNRRSNPRSMASDILNDVLAEGGSISFHTGTIARRFLGKNKIKEEGFWVARGGAGETLQIPFKLVATMGNPISRPEPRAPRTKSRAANE